MGRKVIDEVGHEYGRLTVIRRVDSDKRKLATWLCECECGKRIVTTGARLRKGDTRSCGCSWYAKEMTGQKFGRLTVLRREGSSRTGNATWLCKCRCGKRVVIMGTNLRSGSTKSCGCLRAERVSEARSLPAGEAAFNKILDRMRRAAKRRGYEWQLTKTQTRVLTQQLCYYCGAKPNQGNYLSTLNGVYLYNGLDRIDNSKGYTIDNVVSCCGICNKAKNTQTIEQFKAWIHAVNEYFVK